MPMKNRLSHWTAVGVFGCSAFMAQPTLASLVVHVVMIGLLALNNWLCHRGM